MPPSTSSPIKLAILDDYQNIATPLYESLRPQFEVDAFPETLPSFAHSSTSDETKQQIISRLKPYTVISSMRERTPFPSTLLEQLPNLKLLLTTGNRNAAIDMEAAKRLGIRVTGALGTSSLKKTKGPDSTTQHTVALLLAVARNLVADHNSIQAGKWQTGFATGLSGKVFATLGLGRLGGNVAKIMHQSFGMEILCWSSSLTQETADSKAKDLGLPAEDEEGNKTFKVVTKEELFKQADILSVHYVLSDRSRGIVGSKDLALMKPSAFLVNTSRGPLVDENALFEVLEKGAITGAAVDVFEFEPLRQDSRWRSDGWGKNGKSRVLVTPHTGYVEREYLEAWYKEQVEILQLWLQGEDLPNVLA